MHLNLYHTAPQSQQLAHQHHAPAHELPAHELPLHEDTVNPPLPKGNEAALQASTAGAAAVSDAQAVRGLPLGSAPVPSQTDSGLCAGPVLKLTGICIIFRQMSLSWRICRRDLGIQNARQRIPRVAGEMRYILDTMVQRGAM